MRTRSLLTAAGAALALAVTPTATASAAPSEGARTANPAQSCKSVPVTLAAFEQIIPGYEAPDFDVSACVRAVAARVPDVPVFGSPYAQCAALEEGMMTPGGLFQVTYPYTFHSAPGDPFPDLTAHDRKQCARALYTFHTIESLLPPPPAEEQ